MNEMKNWVSPESSIQHFAANEYTSACYIVYCQTPNNNSYWDEIWDDTDGNGEFDKNVDEKKYGSNWGSFNGCAEDHIGVIQDTPPEKNGFVVKYEGSSWNPKTVWERVFWWMSGTGIHVSTLEGQKPYETNPNAS